MPITTIGPQGLDNPLSLTSPIILGTAAVTNQTVSGAHNVTGNVNANRSIRQDRLYTRGITLVSPATGNAGPGRWYVRLHPISSPAISSVRITIQGSWNWTNTMGWLVAEYSYYTPGDGSISTNDFRVTSTTGTTWNNVRLGNLVSEGGFLSIPVWCGNTNGLWGRVEYDTDLIDANLVTTPWVSDPMPAQNFQSIQGNLVVTGALSKGSGSFRINHPLPALNKTHDLVHSFVESPQADLIYRGVVQLNNGSATVNIDQAAGMTEGTFILLCRDVQCFTSNESDWDAVKGTVVGNTLTVTCENSKSTARISWMVVAERNDQHMYDTDWTDDQGHVIVEPLKNPMESRRVEEASGPPPFAEQSTEEGQ